MLPAFVITSLMSSFLLFALEPMFAKMVLPLLGGAPSTWLTAMLFFQAVLLIAYAYAHGLALRLPLGAQVVLHSAVMAFALLVLPVALPPGWTAPGSGHVPWLLSLMAVSIGLPFFAVCTTSPLVQSWFARTSHARAVDPYFLYAAGNVGSIGGLVVYPAAIERWSALDDQSVLWSLGFALFVGAVVLCGVWAFIATDRSRRGSIADSWRGPGDLRRVTKWIVLAAIPSSLMLGVTTYLTTDIAPIPLLWVIPLGLYLLSFVIVFSRIGSRSTRLCSRALPVAVTALILTVATRATSPLWLLVTLHLVTFWLVAIACHGRLAEDRPPAHGLTSFYFWLAVGGAIGGLFNVVIAPLVFDQVWEYPIAIVAALALRPAPRASRTRVPPRAQLVALAAITIVTTGVVAFVDPAGPEALPYMGGIVYGLPLLVSFLLSDHPRTHAVAVGVIVTVALSGLSGSEVLFTERSFFGVHKVVREDGGFHALTHGNTVHGRQSREPSRAEEPLTYYHPDGPLGAVFRTRTGISDRPSVGIVGLGTGAMACYRRPGERWTFFEIDRVVERLAREARLFSYLDRCSSGARVVVGDGRLELADQEETYGLIAIDAFSSDAIPVHLMTRDAIEAYADRLSEDGVVVFHISNRYLDLAPVLAAIADDLGWRALQGIEDYVTPEELASGRTPSAWFAMAPSRAALDALEEDPWWQPPTRRGPVWTDDFSNVLGALSWDG